MSVLAQMIAPVEDRWPADPSEVPDDALGSGRCSPRTCSGSDRAVANFGGGNTSAKGTTTDHIGRETVDAMWVKGSGSGPSDDAGYGLHAAAPG